VPGAFQHPFQSAPLDLSSPSFRPNRSQAVELRLAEIANGEWTRGRFLEIYEQKAGIRNRLVHWQPELRPLLETALECLGGRRLRAEFNRLSRDVRRFGRGFPDLFVVSGDLEPGFELLEVKGPGDQLRAEQITWLDYLTTNGLPTAVLKIAWADGEH